MITENQSQLLNQIELQRPKWQKAFQAQLHQVESYKKTAAVIVPLIPTNYQHDEWDVLFIQRAGHLRNHAGQIAFPGGSIDPGETPQQTALRETWEEVEIPDQFIQVHSPLPPRLTMSGGHLIYPFVASCDPRANPVPDGVEVDSVLQVPLGFLLRREHIQIRTEQAYGWEYQTYTIDWEGYDIWGATAKILVDFLNGIAPQLNIPPLAAAKRVDVQLS